MRPAVRRAGLTGGEGFLADRSGEAIAVRTRGGEVQRLRVGVAKGDFRNQLVQTSSDVESRHRARLRHGGFADDPDHGGQGCCPQRGRAGG